MKTPTFKTKCTVRLQKSPTNDKDYYLFVEAYPVFENEYSKPKRKSTHINRTISSVIWNTKKKTRGGNYEPKRNVEGVIQCRNKIDQESALFAAQYCAVMQDQYNKKALFPEQYKEQQAQYAREKIQILPYIQEVIKKRQATLAAGTMRVWSNFLTKYQEFENGNGLSFGAINKAKIEEFISFIANYKSKKTAEKLAVNSQKVMINCFQAVLNEAYKEQIITFNPNHVVEVPRGEQKQKQFLTLPQLQTLSNTDCKDETVKRVSLFSALTGLRHSDCVALQWENITDGENPSIKFRQQKTKGMVTMPIFDTTQKHYHTLFGDPFIGTIRRLGLSTFRIAMILTTLRISEVPTVPNVPTVLICSDTDFQTALTITQTLIHHATFIYKTLPEQTVIAGLTRNPQTNTPQQKLLQSLPQEFDRKKYLETAQTLNIPNKTAEKQIEKYLQTNLIERIAHGIYQKSPLSPKS
jgi:integrase